MERLISDMLSWNYLKFVRANSITWDIPTEILYGENDNLTSHNTVKDFAKSHYANVAIMKNGEHWFHTDEQIAFLDKWMKEAISTNFGLKWCSKSKIEKEQEFN